MCFQDSNVETVILISPKFGLSQINSLRNSVVSTLFLYFCCAPKGGVIHDIFLQSHKAMYTLLPSRVLASYFAVERELQS